MSRTFRGCADLGFTMMSMPTIGMLGAIVGIQDFAASALREGSDFDIIRKIDEAQARPLMYKLNRTEEWLGWDKDLK